MNILLLAPHPFYQDRGTPIAVNMVLKVLSVRGEEIDVVTYHEGKDVHYNGVTVYRIPSIPFVRGVRPGFSWKKLVSDLCMFFKVIHLLSKKRYHLVHAVEESVFIAVVLKWFFKIPYVYDMDSSLAQQMAEKYPFLSHVSGFLNSFEGLAVRHAKGVIPVCDALSSVIERYRPGKVVVLHDVPLSIERGQGCIDLKGDIGISGLIFMYVGNLEVYQGIDLLLESFALFLMKSDQSDLVIIGGEVEDIQKYRERSEHLGIEQKVHFLGPKPIEYLSGYLSQADILVSPRIKGKNTPMKLYSYLQSGKVVLATDLPTHTQVLDSHVALLASPTPEDLSRGMVSLSEDKEQRLRLGFAGKKLVEEKYSEAAFRDKLNGLYDWLKMEIEMKRGLLVRMAGDAPKETR